MANNNKPSTSTQIRNMYSDGYSCLNIKFYNTNLSFQWYPFTGTDTNGRSQYDTKNGQQTTVNFEGAYALYQAAKDIIDGKVNETSLNISCLGATINLERKLDTNGQYETIFSISKNNVNIPFKFQTIQQQVKDANGQIKVINIESGLGSFMKTVEGYLTGINADRHLDKLTDEYAKMQENRGQQNGSSYKPTNNFRRPYSQNNNYNRSNQNNWNSNPPQTQTLASYQLPQN